MAGVEFTWDEKKNKENQDKHGVPFEVAQYAFADPNRVIAKDVGHSGTEERYYCFGRLGSAIVTVRFTHRGKRIRIIGAGYWRMGRRIYEESNKKES
jgi:uncharacterized DUF497 family protein